MRKLFITDIHGEHDGLMKLLEHARYEPTVDALVVGGDMISRGPSSGQVLREIHALAIAYPERVTVLTGNHEEMMNWHFGGRSEMWLDHAGKHTLPELRKTYRRESELRVCLDWVAALPLVYEDDEYVYTHAGLVPYDALECQDREILWMSEQEFYTYPAELILNATQGKPVIHGHTPCEFIVRDGARMNCDLGAHTYPIKEARALALVDLTQQLYYVYHLETGEITERRLPHAAG